MDHKSLNPKAWAILNQDEKMALNLHHVHMKSTWEAGEMMGKSHYKYLEIKSRAEHLLKMFQSHFMIYDDEVLPDWVTGINEIKEYFNLTMKGRLKVADANKILNKKYGFVKHGERVIRIEKQMKTWELSSNAYNLTVYNLIKDFDRWNNFRILPPSLREPSAFKRRNKNTQKKHIKYTCTMPDVSVVFLTEHLQPKKKTPESQLIFFPFITLSKEIYVLAVKDKALKEITPFQLYLFKDRKTAEEYIDLVSEYALKSERACREGLEFWPKYREIIKKALNYEEIQHIVPTRRFLELALRDMKIEYF